MPLSLADLRKSEHVGRPETEFRLCVAGKLNAEFDRIDAELERLLAEQPVHRASGDDDQPAGPPTRLGRKAGDPRITKLNQRRDELIALMADHEVALLFRAREDGAWRAWKAAHPPREDNRTDQRAGHDVDALIDALRDHPRDWVATVNGETYTDEDWAFIWSNAADGDQWRMVAVVRGLHETGVDVPKSLSISRLLQMSSGSSS